MSNGITPFWQRVHEFFIYPKNLYAITHILISSALITVGTKLGFVGIIFALIGFFVILKYAYSALQHTADGFTDPPDSINDTSSLSLVVMQVIAYVIGAFVCGLVAEIFGLAAAYISLALFQLWIPASVMIIAVSHSLFNAINPLFFLDFIKRIGPPYLLLWVFLLLLSSGSSQAYFILSNFIPNSLNTFLFAAVFSYFLLIMFHLLGYVIFQYHDVLGYEVNNEALKSHENALSESNEEPFDEFDIKINDLLLAGDYVTAKEQLKIKIGHDPVNLKLHKRYIKLLSAMRLDVEVSAALEQYVNVLIDLKNRKEIAAILNQVSDSIARFRFKKLSLYGLLADIAWEAKQSHSIIKLSKSLHAYQAENPLNMKLGIYEAKMQCEYKHDDDKAIEIISDRISAHPAHPQIEEAKSYLAFLSNLNSTPA